MDGIVIGGVIAGCLYALVALGLTLIWRTSGALNLAQGATASLGAFVVVALAGPGWLAMTGAILAGVACSAVANLAVYLVCVWRLERRNSDPQATLVSTLGATLILVGLLDLLVGYEPHTLHLFRAVRGVRLGGVAVPPVAFVIVLSALLAFALFALVLYRSRLGLVLRMGASNPQLAVLSGVGVTVLRALVWTAAGALSGWGLILFSAYQTLSTGMADALLLSSAVAASWGAFRNVPLTLGGAVVLGVTTNLVQRFVPVVLVSSVSLVLLLIVFVCWQARLGAPPGAAGWRPRRQPRLVLRRHRLFGPAQLLVLLLAGLLVWWYGSGYQLTVLRQLAATAVAVVGVAVALRYGGRLNLGAGGMMILGAYTVVVASRWLPVPVAVLVAMLVTGVAGLLIGAATARMGEIYYAVITLVLTAAVPELVNWAAPVTGGGAGTVVRSLADGVAVAGVPLATPVLAVIAVLALAAYHRFGLSRAGARSLLVATDRPVAMAAGLHPVRYFVLVEVCSCVPLGLGGALLSGDTGYASPTQWGLGYTLILVAAVVVGGGWTALGLAASTALVVLVPTALGGLDSWPQLLFGAALTLSILFAPSGFDGLTAGLLRRPGRREPAAEPGPRPARDVLAGSTHG